MSSSKSSKELYVEVLKCLKGECGVVTDSDKKIAFEKCKKAADADYVPAKNLLAVFYLIGYGTEINREATLGYFVLNDEDSGDLAVYNIGVAKIQANGIEGNWESAQYFDKWANRLRNYKLAKLMSMMRDHLAGELYATESNIGNLMWLLTMKNSYCFLDTDGTIKWINSQGCLSESANNGFNRL